MHVRWREPKGEQLRIHVQGFTDQIHSIGLAQHKLLRGQTWWSYVAHMERPLWQYWPLMIFTTTHKPSNWRSKVKTSCGFSPMHAAIYIINNLFLVGSHVLTSHAVMFPICIILTLPVWFSLRILEVMFHGESCTPIILS